MLERRHHLMLVTRHTEYHVRGRECVGVRDRRTGQWKRWHGALRSRLAGSVRQETLQRNVQLGLPLLFVGSQSFMTSRLVSATRPPKDAIVGYASLAWSGAIESPG